MAYDVEWKEEVIEAREKVAATLTAWNKAKDEAKALKGAHDLAVAHLLEVIDDETPRLPFPEDDPAHGIEDEGAKLPLECLTLAGYEIPEKYAEMNIKGITATKAAAIAEQIEGSTLGDLEAFQREHQDWDRQISGFGEQWITRLQDAQMVIRELFPVPVEFSVQTDDQDDEGDDESEADAE